MANPPPMSPSLQAWRNALEYRAYCKVLAGLAFRDGRAPLNTHKPASLYEAFCPPRPDSSLSVPSGNSPKRGS
jgi:hypothetical protein